MKLLLDTHIFIWWASDPGRLSARALAALEDGGNTLLLSVASAWEMQIKQQLGKLRLSIPLPELVDGQQQRNGLQILSVRLKHVYAVEALPFHHKDPFDRLLIAQADAEGAVLVTADPLFERYPVTTLW